MVDHEFGVDFGCFVIWQVIYEPTGIIDGFKSAETVAEHDKIFDWLRKHRSKQVPLRRERYQCALNFWLGRRSEA